MHVNDRMKGLFLTVLVFFAAYILVGNWIHFSSSSNQALVAISAVSSAFPSGNINPNLDVRDYPIITYFANAGSANVYGLRCVDPACNNVSSRFLVESGTVFPVVTLLGNGNPFFAYTNAQGALKAAACTDSYCSSFTFTLLTGNSTGFVKAVASSQDNTPVIIYSGDLTNNQTVVLHCGNIQCSSGNTQTVVGTNAPNVSIDISQDGLPIATMVEGSPGQVGILKVIKCENYSCTQYHVNTVSPADVLEATISANNSLPFIAYVRGDYKIVTLACSTPDCQTYTKTIQPNYWGGMLSIGIPPSGLPLISFIGNTVSPHGTYGMYTLACTDSLCLNNTTLFHDSEAKYQTVMQMSKGKPLIFYYSESLGAGIPQISRVKCADYSCSSAQSIVLDSGNIQPYTTVAADASNG